MRLPDCEQSGLPPLFGLAPGGVCHAAAVAGGAVRSYRTLSPLPAGSPQARTPAGGLLSVALSLGSPPPGVTRLRIPVEPGLSSTKSAGRNWRRSSGRLAKFRLYRLPTPSSRETGLRQKVLQNRPGGAVGDAVHTGLTEMALKRAHNGFAFLAVMAVDPKAIAEIEEIFL